MRLFLISLSSNSPHGPLMMLPSPNYTLAEHQLGALQVYISKNRLSTYCSRGLGKNVIETSLSVQDISSFLTSIQNTHMIDWRQLQASTGSMADFSFTFSPRLPGKLKHIICQIYSAVVCRTISVFLKKPV